VCTAVFRIAPGEAWPLLLAANRDERLDRAWDAPGPWWPDRPGTVAGRDRLGGGTWMAMRAGIVAAVLNRVGSLGPAAGKRSRGELPLWAVAETSAEAAAGRFAGFAASEWRSFNLVVADRESAWFVRGLGHGRPDIRRLEPGVHMLTAHDPDDRTSPRVARHLPRFVASPAPSPPDWRHWPHLLADRAGPAGAAINVGEVDGFGTVCSSLAGIPAEGASTWLFAAGPPDQAAFLPVALP